MGCRIGMATDVANRVSDLKAKGNVPQRATYVTLKSGLTYKQANEFENKRREACGSHCDGARGGSPGSYSRLQRVWSVYRIDW